MYFQSRGPAPPSAGARVVFWCALVASALGVSFVMAFRRRGAAAMARALDGRFDTGNLFTTAVQASNPGAANPGPDVPALLLYHATKRLAAFDAAPVMTLETARTLGRGLFIPLGIILLTIVAGVFPGFGAGGFFPGGEGGGSGTQNTATSKPATTESPHRDENANHHDPTTSQSKPATAHGEAGSAEQPQPAPADAPKPPSPEGQGSQKPPDPPEPVPEVEAAPSLVPLDAAPGPRADRKSSVLEVTEGFLNNGPVAPPARRPVVFDDPVVKDMERAVERAIRKQSFTPPERAYLKQFFDLLRGR